MVRHYLKTLIARINPDLYERALALSLVRHKFFDLTNAACFDKREEMWEYTLGLVNQSPLLFLEFGVWKGYSINYFSSNCSDLHARFFGFDSFVGLPEDWTPELGRGAFSTNGSSPETTDQRIQYVKGWFDDTVPAFLEQNKSELSDGELIVHFDADLYSSTLFCLVQLDGLKREYLAIFDEFFSGHETRALYDYSKAFGADIEMLAKTSKPGSMFPAQVLCRVKPKTTAARGSHADG